MGFDEIYEQMLQDEFGSGHTPPVTNGQASQPVLPGLVTAQGSEPLVERPGEGAQTHSAPSGVGTVATEGAAVGATVGELPTPTWLSRYRNAALVGAGGLSFAAVGAFLGGLGGPFSIGPAALHPFEAWANPRPSIAGAVDNASRSADRGEASAHDVASFSSLGGGLVQGIEPSIWLTTSSTDNLGLLGAPKSPLCPPLMPTAWESRRQRKRGDCTHRRRTPPSPQRERRPTSVPRCPPARARRCLPLPRRPLWVQRSCPRSPRIWGSRGLM